MPNKIVKSSSVKTSTKAMLISATAQEKVPEQIESDYSTKVDSYIAAAQSAATTRAYASDLRHFKSNGGTVPATANQVVEYLAQFAGKLSASTLERRLIAIHQAHVAIAAVSPAADLMVRRTLQGIRRTFGTKQRQMRPIVKDDLAPGLRIP